ncbi:MAG: outer membrane beta-barrel protein [Bacteroidaceae bacterium]|nr:outer membrane beta-barrel protein [Bacteroidaceae bacterium]
MKKIFTTMTLALVTVAMSAQVYVGGGFNAWRDADNNKTTAGISPEVGYKLSDKWALGMGMDCQYSYDKGTDVYRVAAMPYVRYTAAWMGPVGIFADCTGGVAIHKVNGGDSHTCWEAGIKPGVIVTLTPQLSFLAHTGFLGYRDAGKYNYFGDGGFGFNMSTADLSFGLLWNF